MAIQSLKCVFAQLNMFLFFLHFLPPLQTTGSPINERGFINTTSLSVASDDEMIDITPNNVSNPNYQYHLSSNGSGGSGSREDGVGASSSVGGSTGSIGGAAGLHAGGGGSDNGGVRTTPTHHASRFGRDFHSDHEGMCDIFCLTLY